MEESPSDFPPESYSTSYNLRNEIKQYLITKGLAIFKNGVMTLGPNYKQSGKESWRPSCCSSEGKRCRRQHQQPDDNPLLKFLALNALELTAPASDILLRSEPGGGGGGGGCVSENNCLGSAVAGGWFQLSGHPDAFAPAGPGTVWKKCSGGDERAVYEALDREPALRGVTPAYLRQVHYRGQTFIELQDLLHSFRDPHVMDVKMGVRTFLESEVQNTTARHDLYLKMVSMDPDAPTEEEHQAKAVTKLRYMMFREKQSSSCSLGFRIEAMKFRGSPPVTDMKRVKNIEQVSDTMSLFFGSRDDMRQRLVSRLQEIKSKLEQSVYFKQHEVIGSSILIVYDDTKVGAWLIDFAKTRPVPEGVRVNHRSPWSPGNHEEGFLMGLDNLIRVLENVKVSTVENTVTASKPVALKS